MSKSFIELFTAEVEAANAAGRSGRPLAVAHLAKAGRLAHDAANAARTGRGQALVSSGDETATLVVKALAAVDTIKRDERESLAATHTGQSWATVARTVDAVQHEDAAVIIATVAPTGDARDAVALARRAAGADAGTTLAAIKSAVSTYAAAKSDKARADAAAVLVASIDADAAARKVARQTAADKRDADAATAHDAAAKAVGDLLLKPAGESFAGPITVGMVHGMTVDVMDIAIARLSIARDIAQYAADVATAAAATAGAAIKSDAADAAAAGLAAAHAVLVARGMSDDAARALLGMTPAATPPARKPRKRAAA